MTGALAVDLEFAFPHIAHARSTISICDRGYESGRVIPLALYAHFWQYVWALSNFVLQVLHELEYAAYGFLADFDNSLL
jgi:hypothetical protein